MHYVKQISSQEVRQASKMSGDKKIVRTNYVQAMFLHPSRKLSRRPSVDATGLKRFSKVCVPQHVWVTSLNQSRRLQSPDRRRYSVPFEGFDNIGRFVHTSPRNVHKEPTPEYRKCDSACSVRKVTKDFKELQFVSTKEDQRERGRVDHVMAHRRPSVLPSIDEILPQLKTSSRGTPLNSERRIQERRNPVYLIRRFLWEVRDSLSTETQLEIEKLRHQQDK